MIRINLLSVERERAKPRAGLQAGQWLTILCSLLLLGTALFIGWWHWSLGNQLTRLDADIVAAQQETERLRGELQRVNEFNRLRTELERRVTLIEQLRRGQSEPVHLLDEVSLSLPDMLWLTELRQKGPEITIDGRAVSLAALSDFVGNLERSAYFRQPVEILSSSVESQAQGDLVRFQVKAQFAAPAGAPGAGLD